MRSGIHLAELVHRHQSVDLRGGDGGMTKQFLHNADVRAAVEQVGGERMPQGVR
jgi:hypothetical protein